MNVNVFSVSVKVISNCCLVITHDYCVADEFGQKKPPYYCFMPSFWCTSRGGGGGGDVAVTSASAGDRHVTLEIDSDQCEEVPHNMQHKNVIR